VSPAAKRTAQTGMQNQSQQPALFSSKALKHHEKGKKK